ncbi:MAG: thermonuclease family protein [Candidatus Nanohaloarchaea archaeon]
MKVELVLLTVILVSGCTSSTQVYDATTIEVRDGDTIRADTGGRPEEVRLRGVDTPEISGPVDPEEYEGVPDNQDARECLKNWGYRARNYTAEFVSGEYQLVTDGKRGIYGRLLASAKKENRSLNRLLIRKGYARVYDSDYSRKNNFTAIEQKAQKNMTGLWSCRIYQLQEIKIK